MQTLKEIALDLGLCKDTVRRGMLKLGIIGVFRKNVPGKADLLFTSDEVEMFKKSYEDKNKKYEGFITAGQLADLVGYTRSWVSNISVKYKIDHILTSDHNSKIAYYSKDAVDKIVKIAELRKNNKSNSKKIIEIVSTNTAKAEDHPLVKDLRCLDFKYWPDIVPNCFKDLDA